MASVEGSATEWGNFPFDRELTFNSIPNDVAVTAIHVSVLPDPDDGGVRILGRMANGGTGSVTFYGRVIAAKLPFADRVIRLQYLGSTRSVGITLTAYK